MEGAWVLGIVCRVRGVSGERGGGVSSCLCFTISEIHGDCVGDLSKTTV